MSVGAVHPVVAAGEALFGVPVSVGLGRRALSLVIDVCLLVAANGSALTFELALSTSTLRAHGFGTPRAAA